VRPIRVTFPTIEFIETDVRATAWDDEGNVTETIGNACTETRFAVVVDHRRDPRNV
jgi:hypothetical protein